MTIEAKSMFATCIKLKTHGQELVFRTRFYNNKLSLTAQFIIVMDFDQ